MSKWPKIDLKSPWGRVKLVPPPPEDDDDIVALRGDPEALKYLIFMPCTQMSLEEWRARREAHAQKDEIWNFHVHSTAPSTTQPSRFMGQCGIINIDIPNRHGEIGILLVSRFHRTGVATEALHVLLSHAFEHPDLKLHRAEFVTASTNVQMRGWLEGFGIKSESRRREAWSDGQGGWIDSVGYSILEGEWPALKAKLENWLATRFPSGGDA